MSKSRRRRAPISPTDLPTLALTVGGLGFLRPAPGTWGSVPPVVIVAGLAALGASQSVLYWVTGAILLVSSVVCVVWGRYAEQRFGQKDASEVVADETAGVCLPVLVVLIMVSEALIDSTALAAPLTAAFVLFRVFDIAKLWPMRNLESLPYGWGVLLDDLMAGIYAAAVLALAYAWLAN